MNEKWQQIKLTLAPYNGIIRFVVALLATHFIWKYTIIGEEDSQQLLLLHRWDISAPFLAASAHVAEVVYSILHAFGSAVDYHHDYILSYPNNNGVRIVWGCTGIKQSVILTVILLASRGDWRRKLWFIPLGILLCYVTNIVRITVITATMENHPEWFHFLHDYFFKYLFYGIIFLYWVWWEERIGKKSRDKKAEQVV